MTSAGSLPAVGPRRWLSWLLVALLCVAVVTGLGFIKYRQLQAAIAFGEAFPEPVEAIEVIVARHSLWQPETTVTGEVRAPRQVTLRTEVAGVISEVGYASGSAVDAGQRLLTLRSQEEEAELAAARANLRIAELDLERAHKLIATGATTADTLDRARAGRDAAQARVRSIEARLTKKRIVAPFAARTSLHSWEAGQFVDKNTEVSRLVGLDDTLWVDFSLPQEQALRFSSARPVEVLGEGSGPEAASALARVLAQDPALDANSRNLRFRAAFSKTELSEVPGALVRVRIPLGTPQPVTLVPVTAVRRDSFGTRVFTLVAAEENAPAKERASLRTVTIGSQIGTELVITSGLTAGERLAATGAFKLRDGVLVNPSEYRDPAG